MRLFLICIVFAQSFLLQAQNFEDEWTGFFSYNEVIDIVHGDDVIYAASENALFKYDLSTQETQTISTVNGLSGESISTLYYSEANNLLIIGYETGLLEVLVDDEDNVLKVVDILEKQSIPPDQKRINHFNEYNNILYIATAYGISLYDLQALEFGDTYFIGDFGAQINITQTTVFSDYIFASTSDSGIRRAFVNDENLIDYQQWSLIAPGGFKGIQTVNTAIYAVSNSNEVYQYTLGGGLTFLQAFNSSIVDFGGQNDMLTITTRGSIQAYSETFQLLSSVSSIPGYDFVLNSGYALNNNFYLGTKEFGMLEVIFGSNQAVQILPDGPLYNTSFGIDASPGQLWTVFGDVDVNFNPYPLTERGISNYKVEEGWTNIPFENLFEANDLVRVAINPNNPSETYMTSFQKGLLKVEETIPTVLYNETNSPLEIPFDNPAVGIRLFGMDYDRQGNLWFVQSRSNEGLVRYTPNGQFQKIDLTSIINGEEELALSDVAVSREGYVFFGAIETGVVGYNTQTGTFNKIGEGIGGGNLPSVNVRALTFDSNNRLWIGTLEGLRVLFNASSFFQEGANTDAQAIIILEDDVPQELLFEQSITDIVVDGSNNKWISTATSGVFYLSPNGQETLLRFTKDNSPLPSDNVIDIAIDELSGVVYFATQNGLVSYNGTSTAPRDNLEGVYAYPNPVRPSFTGNVTIDGLTARANVKITDIEGNLVFEEVSEGGSVLWDTTAFGKYRVASGVYLVLITTDDALETKISKIMIIR